MMKELLYDISRLAVSLLAVTADTVCTCKKKISSYAFNKANEYFVSRKEFESSQHFHNKNTKEQVKENKNE